MRKPESFKIEIDGHTLAGTICLPEAGNGPSPGVLICRNLVDHNPTIDQLWDEFIDRATECGRAVITFEPRCAHLILDDFDRYSLEDYWRDAESVLSLAHEHEAIANDLMAVTGYRLGSLAALRLASTHHTIEHLCLVTPLLDGRYVSGASDPGRNGEPTPAHLPKRMLEQLESFDAAELFDAYAGEVLIIHGAADHTTAPEQSIGYDRLMHGSGIRSRLELIARADHLFSQPETRHACIDRLLRGCAAEH